MKTNTEEYSHSSRIKWGFTFSGKYCRELGLEEEEVFVDAINSGQFEVVRLCAYWDEPVSRLKWQVDNSLKAGLEVVIAGGQKVPRWPEYHIPQGVTDLPANEFNKKLYDYWRELIEEFSGQVSRWQVENEPFDEFGIYEKRITLDGYKSEVRNVKNLLGKKGKNHQIIGTASSENLVSQKFLQEMGGDVIDMIGLNLYTHVPRAVKKLEQRVLNRFIGDYRKINHDVIRLKEKFNRASNNYLLAELQAEPWGINESDKLNSNARKSMNSEILLGNLKLAQSLGAEEIWIWGVEWWHAWQKLYGEDYTEIFNKFRLGLTD